MYCSLSATPLGLNLDLVTSDNQACSQRKGTLIFSQVPLRTNDGKTLSVREAGNNFCPPQQDWDLALAFSTISITWKILGRVVKGGDMRGLL